MEERWHDALDRVEKLEAILRDIQLYTMDPWAQKQAIQALEGKVELRAEIARLHQYESMVHYIANDYIELSYEKAQCQRDDWLKRCRKTIAEAPPEWTENYGQGSEPWLKDDKK
jgi:hypothetical protein